MGRLNEVLLFGVVDRRPVIKKTESGELAAGIGTLHVLRPTVRSRSGKEHIGLSSPFISTRDPVQIAFMGEWKVNDIVLIKGFFATRLVNKVSLCPYCGGKNRQKGVLSYIEPIFIKTVDHAPSEEEAHDALLHDYRELSNSFRGMGNVLEDPGRMVFKTTESSGFSFLQYKLAISRLFRVRDDPADKTVDFPWVKVYGEACDRDYYRLKAGSQVYIDGYVQTRHVCRHMTCASCGAAYEWNENTMEVVPYHTEYVAGFRTEEEVEALQKQKNETAFRSAMKGLFAGAGMGDELIDEEDERSGTMPDA